MLFLWNTEDVRCSLGLNSMVPQTPVQEYTVIFIVEKAQLSEVQLLCIVAMWSASTVHVVFLPSYCRGETF